ncbi:hypothetical protein [Maritimibacter dapengensis]|uniref:Lipoprotein n=1 Tax=Maritimibacter dapengensis TaxID=2836868 RepID=A0ABS6T3P0_9RHOB|nr:hypothetical protein [Maritimibacter dapengensis]MBV7379869.1 hypothetical protein [Maritimibacter dapengensis]
MRSVLPGLALALTLPLAGCFDADVTADFTDREAVTLDAVLTIEAEGYQMIAGMGQDPCEEGVSKVNDDGSYTCTMTDQRTLEQLLAAMNDPEDELGIGDGITVTELNDGNLSVSFDLTAMTSDLPPPEERAQVAAMFGAAFDGHAITMSVVAEEIIATNGEISADGTTAKLVIPLTEMFSAGVPNVPNAFDVELVPGG